MNILNQQINLHMKKGKFFPHNVVFMGYVFLGVAVFAFIMKSIYLGGAFLLVSLLLSFTTYGTKIRIKTCTIDEYVSYFGFIRIKKTIDYRKFSIIMVVPAKQTNTMYARDNMSLSYTDSYHGIFLVSENYRSRKELNKFEKKQVAVEAAKMLANLMHMEYVGYDPEIIRGKMLNS